MPKVIIPSYFDYNLKMIEISFSIKNKKDDVTYIIKSKEQKDLVEFDYKKLKYCYDKFSGNFLCCKIESDFINFYISNDWKNLFLYEDTTFEDLFCSVLNDTNDFDIEESEFKFFNVNKELLLPEIYYISNGKDELKIVGKFITEMLIKYDYEWKNSSVVSEEMYTIFKNSNIKSDNILTFYNGNGFLSVHNLIPMYSKNYTSYFSALDFLNIYNKFIKEGNYIAVDVSNMLSESSIKDSAIYIEFKNNERLYGNIVEGMLVFNSKKQVESFTSQEMGRIVDYLSFRLEKLIGVLSVVGVNNIGQKYTYGKKTDSDLLYEKEIKRLNDNNAYLNNKIIDMTRKLDDEKKKDKKILDLSNEINYLHSNEEYLKNELSKYKDLKDNYDFLENEYNMVKGFFGRCTHDFGNKWMDYDSIEGNLEYYKSFYKEYNNDNLKYLSFLLKKINPRKKNIKIAILGGGNGLELAALNDLVNTSEFNGLVLSITIVDLIIWPLNFIMENNNINDIEIKVADYLKFIDELGSKKNDYDIIYFSRVINYTDCDRNNFSTQLNGLQKALDDYKGILAFVQIELILKDGGNTNSYQNLFKKVFGFKIPSKSNNSKSYLYVDDRRK